MGTLVPGHRSHSYCSPGQKTSEGGERGREGAVTAAAEGGGTQENGGGEGKKVSQQFSHETFAAQHFLNLLQFANVFTLKIPIHQISGKRRAGS